LANLLANARTHTPAGTTITLSVRPDGTGAVLRVHDDGPGIDPEVREELFARFARGDVSRARQTGGTGLGLAIAKAIVDGHGGTIEVTSTPGDTAFTVRLPGAPGSDATAPDEAVAGAPAATDGPTATGSDQAQSPANAPVVRERAYCRARARSASSPGGPEMKACRAAMTCKTRPRPAAYNRPPCAQ